MHDLAPEGTIFYPPEGADSVYTKQVFNYGVDITDMFASICIIIIIFFFFKGRTRSTTVKVRLATGVRKTDQNAQ